MFHWFCGLEQRLWYHPILNNIYGIWSNLFSTAWARIAQISTIFNFNSWCNIAFLPQPYRRLNQYKTSLPCATLSDQRIFSLNQLHWWLEKHNGTYTRSEDAVQPGCLFQSLPQMLHSLEKSVSWFFSHRNCVGNFWWHHLW